MPPNDPEELAPKDPPDAMPPRPPYTSRSADVEPEDWKEVEEEENEEEDEDEDEYPLCPDEE